MIAGDSEESSEHLWWAVVVLIVTAKKANLSSAVTANKIPNKDGN